MTTLEQEQTREAWETIAAGYDEYVTPTHVWLGNESATRAGVGPGQRFLDVAAGSGALSIPAARLGANVVATDISSTMLSGSRRARLPKGWPTSRRGSWTGTSWTSPTTHST